MGYIAGYNSFTNHLLTSWDIQVPVCVLDSSLNESSLCLLYMLVLYGELRFYNVGNIGASAEPMFARRFVTGLIKLIDFCWVGKQGKTWDFYHPPPKKNDSGWKAMISEVISCSGPWNSGKPKSPKILLERTSISTSQSDGYLGSFNSFNLQQRWIGQGWSQEHLRWLRCI